MNKATKGTLAIAAGVVLLFGGGGSLAYWSSQATVTPAQVTTGQLTIGTASSSGWSVEKYLGSSFTSVDTTSYLAVPGDTLQYAATFPVT
ncbi:alternate-type signal peptide domain-containing protein, partial [Acinetobacter baumannii]